ncbi:MAG: SRPBCC family protein [Saprospiraceae bacterium]|nr:SRPBCC family protein [Saprospiraceae bacterium]
MADEILTTTPDCEIVSSRIVDAPVNLVFRAWAEPNHLINWWGPSGFTNTFNVFDFRVGGIWSYIMHGPDKGHYANECEFIKIKPPSLIAWKRYSKPIFQVLFTLEEVSEDKTKIVFKMLFNSAEGCRKVNAFAVDKNEENFDRLEVELGRMKL